MTAGVQVAGCKGTDARASSLPACVSLLGTVCDCVSVVASHSQCVSGRRVTMTKHPQSPPTQPLGQTRDAHTQRDREEERRRKTEREKSNLPFDQLFPPLVCLRMRPLISLQSRRLSLSLTVLVPLCSSGCDAQPFLSDGSLPGQEWVIDRSHAPACDGTCGNQSLVRYSLTDHRCSLSESEADNPLSSHIHCQEQE